MCLREAPRSLGPEPTGMVTLVASTICVRRPAADLLRDGPAVGVGRVDEVAARLEVAVDERQRLALLAAPLGHAEGHRPEADLGDTEAGAPEGADAHG